MGEYIGIVMFEFSLLERKHTFWTIVVKKLKNLYFFYVVGHVFKTFDSVVSYVNDLN